MGNDTTRLEERILGEVPMTREKVDAFRFATQDPNEIHGHEKGATLGFQSKFVLAYLVSMKCKPAVPATQETTFSNAVPIGVNAWCTSRSIPEGVEARMYLPGLDKPAVTSKFSYRSLSQPTTFVPRHDGVLHSYTLSEAVARQAGKGISADVPAWDALAVGLVSSAFYKDGAKAVDEQRARDRQPVYMRQTVSRTEHPPLRDGDSILIETNCRDVRPVERRGAVWYTPKAVISREGFALYTVEATIAFVETAKVMEALGATKNA
jgi:hypothetical protein